MEERQRQIQECRAQVQELTRQLNALSARIDRLEGANTPAPISQPIPAPVQKKPTPSPVTEEPGPEVWTALGVQSAPAQKKILSTEHSNLEGVVGKNLFAVLASVLVLLGVGVFISTIYEHIPEIVKIGAIYVFGFLLLGSGLVIYRSNDNKFWLGVASCGLAELLVSIITSHSYFQVLSLPWTFLLILVWILGSFWLTRFHPTVFKSIGYAGFIISIILGLNLLSSNDLVIYLTLAAAYAVLSLFFMVTHQKHQILNTVMAFCSVLGLLLFLDLPGRLPGNLDWLGGLLVLGVLALFHGTYLLVGKLHEKAYPIFAGLTLAVWSPFLLSWEMAYLMPAVIAAVLVLWYLSQRTTGEIMCRDCYVAFAGVYLVTVGISARYTDENLLMWFVAFAAVASALHWLTKQRDVAWLSLVGNAIFCFFTNMDSHMVPLAFGVAVAFFVFYSSPLVREDKPLRAGWYLLCFAMSHMLKDWLRSHMYAEPMDYRQFTEICDALYFAIMAMVNTAYLHLSLRDKEKLLRVDIRSIAVMIPQVVLILGCLNYVGSQYWYVSLLGVASSLLLVSYSLHYSLRTRGRENNLMIWQFVKFTLYCWTVLSLLESPDILLNICLLLIAIAAIVLGFRLGHKSVRIYGLVLSLVDVVGLVLFNIDFSDSLQLAGGIVLCGVLCFVISFIYSRISRTALNKDAV